MPTSRTAPCPSCHAPMEVHVLPGTNGVHGGTVELDLCFACQGMRFDPFENLKLAQGFDVVRSGRYITYRCANGHGRFSAFSSFMIEKGFVRQLTRPEIDDIARRVAVIHCTGCGAPVDLRKDHACPHCRSAFSLLDPQAVENALQGYAKAATANSNAAPAPHQVHDVADALIAIERYRTRTRPSIHPQHRRWRRPAGSGCCHGLGHAELT